MHPQSTQDGRRLRGHPVSVGVLLCSATELLARAGVRANGARGGALLGGSSGGSSDRAPQLRSSITPGRLLQFQ